jgi:glutathione S-transferase|tara:strand:- start:4612 stop:5283 length:672 start_codon:yes stop_codon:yes gene_type:complete
MATLYHYPLCPFSRKVRLLLRERNIDPDLIVEAYWQRRKEFLKTNPSGEVPVLIMKEEKICGHYAITEYLEENHESLLPKDNIARNEIRRIVDWFDNKFHYEVGKIILDERVQKRFLKVSKGGGLPRLERIRIAIHNLNYHMDYINTLIAERFWLTDDQISLADLTASAHISCLDYLGDIPWKKYPAVKDWYTRIKCRPSFRSLLMDQVMSIPPRGKYATLDF